MALLLVFILAKQNEENMLFVNILI